MKSFKGHISYYRIYDIGQEIDLKKSVELLNKKNLTEQFKLKRLNRSLVIEEAPLVVSLGSVTHEILGKNFQLSATGKLWHFGSISINFKIHIPVEIDIKEFKNLAYLIENDERLDKMARDSAYQIVRDLGDAVRLAGIWSQFEDYIIFNLDPHHAESSNLQDLLESDDFYQLILTETNVDLSSSVRDSIKAHAVQYSTKDIAVIDWNSAFVCSKDDAQDICDVIEFGLCQSLELRYYDDKLDKKLSALYKTVQSKQTRLFSSPFSKLAEDAALFYIEISDIKEKINNSLKVIGDVHYAKIYRVALERLRLKDWNASVEEKLDNLKEIALIFQSDVNEKRNLFLEITIILLIAVEVVPLLIGFFKKIF